MKIHISLTIIIFSFFSIINNNIYAYNGPNHHKNMGEIASEESVLDTYLKENLGFSQGITSKFKNPDENLPEREKTKSVKEWIGYGGNVEDDISTQQITRSNNHFYDPTTNAGLSDWPEIGAISSLTWGKEHEWNNYSWAKARQYYYLALTSQTKEQREKYWALTFRTLGQVCHLVQDLGSPAHVRNDNHINGDPYEDWSKNTYDINNIMLLGMLGNTYYQYPVVQMDKFDDYWDDENGKGLAEFTNSNFISGDTNFDVLSGPHHYENPHPLSGFHEKPYTFVDSNGVTRTENVTYIRSEVQDHYDSSKSVPEFNYLTAISRWNFYTRKYNPNETYYTLNSKCHQEYAKLLVPRTVGYSAGLLNYFFRGKLEVEVEMFYDGEYDGQFFYDPPKFRLTITPVSEYEFEAFSEDNFEIYCDVHFKNEPPYSGRYMIEDVEYHFEGNIVIAEFAHPFSDRINFDLRGFTVVYQGVLGGEEVVLGKNILLCSWEYRRWLFNNIDCQAQINDYNYDKDVWGWYFSEDWINYEPMVPMITSPGICREDIWIIKQNPTNQHYVHGATRSYYKIATDRFSSINSAKLIGLKACEVYYGWAVEELQLLEFAILFYQIAPWQEPINESTWTRRGEYPGRLFGSTSTEGIVPGTVESVSIEWNPATLSVDEPIYLEVKSDKEWVNFVPQDYTTPSSKGVFRNIYFFQLYFVIEGTLDEP